MWKYIKKWVCILRPSPRLSRTQALRPFVDSGATCSTIASHVQLQASFIATSFKTVCYLWLAVTSFCLFFLPVYILFHNWEIWRGFWSLWRTEYLFVLGSTWARGLLWLIGIIRVRGVRFKTSRFAASDLENKEFNKLSEIKLAMHDWDIEECLILKKSVNLFVFFCFLFTCIFFFKWTM